MTLAFGFKARDFEVFDLGLELTNGFFRLLRLPLQLSMKLAPRF